MDCAEHYKEVHKLHTQILAATCAFPDFPLHAEAHAFVEDLLVWEQMLLHNPETMVLRKAIVEYQNSLVLVTIGHYRAAFVSLRSFLELIILYTDHSANLLHHHQWLRAARDLNWASLVEPETGVLSKTFCVCFFEGLVSEIPHFLALARATYRECSEFAHGNATKDDLLPPVLEASEVSFRKWQDTAKSARYVSLFALSMRHLLRLPPAERAKIEPTILEALGHMPVIRSVFSTPRS
jgi:hypothetical protein